MVRVAGITSLLMMFLGASVAEAQLDVEFLPSTRADNWDARTYRGIWDEYGGRILAALEARSCLSFPESNVAAEVAEATSHSGGPDHPMRLRASYARDVKQSTLVHELGHRHLWQLEERLDDVDGHMTLYLILDRVWADVWGESFAEARIQGESAWDTDYEEAWAWASSLTLEERERHWNRLLAMNGFPARCDSLTADL